MKIAKIRHRVMATLVDNVFCFLVALVAFIGVWPTLIYDMSHAAPLNTLMILKLIFCVTIYTIFLLIFYVVVPMSNYFEGQTIGKKLFKIKIVREDGEKLTYQDLFYREAICRILIRTLSIGISSIVSFIVLLLSEDKRTIADVFAKTKVIDIKKEEEYYAN